MSTRGHHGIILNAGGGAGPALPGALDAYLANLALAGGLKRLVGGYDGAAVRVRRSSDNAEADVGFLEDGTLDTATLLAHVGAGDGFVTTIYDQSGNGFDMVQEIAANQGKIASAGTYMGKIANTGSTSDNRYLSVVDIPGGHNQMTIAGRVLSTNGDSAIFSFLPIAGVHPAGVTYTLSQRQSDWSGQILMYLISDLTSASTSTYHVSHFSHTWVAPTTHMFLFDNTKSGWNRTASWESGNPVARALTGWGEHAAAGNFGAAPFYIGHGQDIYDFALWKANLEGSAMDIHNALNSGF